MGGQKWPAKAPFAAVGGVLGGGRGALLAFFALLLGDEAEVAGVDDDACGLAEDADEVLAPDEVGEEEDAAHQQFPPPDEIAAALSRAALRYRKTPRKFRYYAVAKYRMDPCYRALCERIPDATQGLDLGCGLGMLAVALAELGEGRQTLGIDWDAAKIAAGQQAAVGLWGVTLQRGDLREQPFAPCDFITLVDVLHYYEPAVQTQVLQRAAAALRPGGQLLIRETDPERRGAVRLTRFIERLMVRLGWNRGPAVHYRPLAALHAELRALGLATEQLELAGATHPGNVLVCAHRPALWPASRAASAS